MDKTKDYAAVGEAVVRELDELEKLGVVVPKLAREIARLDAGAYRDNGMKIGEIADLVIQVAQIEEANRKPFRDREREWKNRRNRK